MKRRTQKIGILNSKMALRGLLLMVALVGVTSFALGESGSALEYQTDADVQFTINESITVTVTGSLTLDELAPGNYADSDVATVAVATNSLGGYVLQTTVGTSSGNTNLTNTTNSSYYFTSLGTSDSLASMASATAGTWGYSYSTDAGSSWSNYSGLPLDGNSTSAELGKGGTSLIDTSTAADSRSVKFKIGAKATAAQALGDYTNTINFYAVTYQYSQS